MKKTLSIPVVFVAPVIALALAGCDRISEERPVAEAPSAGNVFFSFTNPEGTKGSTGAADNTINYAQVAVFNGDSQIGYEDKNISAVSGTVEVPGLPLNVTLDCYAVVNCSESIKGKTKAQIEAMEVLLKDCSATDLPMYATGSKSFREGDLSLTMNLHRAVSKIEIRKVTAQFKSEAIAEKTGKVTAIYVYNAPGKYRISLSEPSSQVYYHSDGYSSADAGTLGSAASLVGETGLNGVFTGNKAYTTGHDFYCCPNSGDTTWLTIETSIGGQTYYYGVQMPQLVENTQYIVTNAVLTGLGNIVPPGIVDNGNIRINLTVADWATGFSKEVSF